VIYRKRKSEPAMPEIPVVRPPIAQSEDGLHKPIKVAAATKSTVTQTPALVPVPSPIGTEATSAAPSSFGASHNTAIERQPTFVLDVQGGAAGESRNERILAGISENIKKSLQMRPVPQHSPIAYSESKPRNTEYVRVKKEIITPHGQIRFSILKDW